MSKLRKRCNNKLVIKSTSIFKSLTLLHAKFLVLSIRLYYFCNHYNKQLILIFLYFLCTIKQCYCEVYEFVKKL